jgi:hypothetical protein
MPKPERQDSSMAGQTKEVEMFLQDLVEVCRKHRFSLGHEDTQGGFVVESLEASHGFYGNKLSNLDWLLQADDRTQDPA